MMVWISSMKTTTLPLGAAHLVLEPEELLGEGAAQLGAGHHAGHVDLDHGPLGPRAAALQQPLGDPLDDGGLAHARARRPAAGCWCAACRGRRWPPRPRARARPAGRACRAAASSVRLRPSCESQGNSLRVEGVAAERGAARGCGRGARGPGVGRAAGRRRPAGRPRSRLRSLLGGGSTRGLAEASPSVRVAWPGRAGARPAARRAARARRDRAPAGPAVLARQAVGEEADGLGAEPARVDAAGGRAAGGRSRPAPRLMAAEQVEAVDLAAAGPGGERAGLVAEVAGQPLVLARLAGHHRQDPVLVDPLLAQQDLGAVGHGEEGQELMGAGERLVHAPRDVLRLAEDLQELHRLDGKGHVPARFRYRAQPVNISADLPDRWAADHRGGDGVGVGGTPVQAEPRAGLQAVRCVADPG